MKTLNKILFMIGCFSIFLINTKAQSTEEFTYGAWPSYYYLNKELNGIKESTELHLIARYSDAKESYSLSLFGTKKRYLIDFNIINSKQANYLNISEEKFKLIEALTHYGYLYKDHTDTLWYAVTQKAIYEVLYPDSKISISKTQNGPNIPNASLYYKELISLVNNESTIFPKSLNINLNEHYIYQNNALKEYHLSESSPYINLTNDTLDILGTTDIKSINLVKGSDVPIYDSPDAFPIIPINDNPISTQEIKLNVTSTTLKLNFKSNYKYETVCNTSNVFGLFNSNNELIKSLDLHDLKTFELFKIPYGKYYLKMLSNACNTLKDPNTYEFIIDSKETTKTITLKENIKKLLINKKVCIDSKCQNESHAKYLIYNATNSYEAFTNKSGNISLDIPSGIYNIKEILGLSNYELSKDIIINTDTEPNQNFSLNLSSNIKKENLIVKVIDNNSKPVIGAEIGLYNLKHQLITSLKTDAYGLLKFNVNISSYYIKELSVNSSYKLNSNYLKIDLTKETSATIKNSIVEEQIDEKITNPETSVTTNNYLIYIILLIIFLIISYQLSKI